MYESSARSEGDIAAQVCSYPSHTWSAKIPQHSVKNPFLWIGHPFGVADRCTP